MRTTRAGVCPGRESTVASLRVDSAIPAKPAKAAEDTPRNGELDPRPTPNDVAVAVSRLQEGP